MGLGHREESPCHEALAASHSSGPKPSAFFPCPLRPGWPASLLPSFWPQGPPGFACLCTPLRGQLGLSLALHSGSGHPPSLCRGHRPGRLCPGPCGLDPKDCVLSPTATWHRQDTRGTLREPESGPEAPGLKLIKRQLKMGEREVLGISCRVKTGLAV